MNKFPIAKFLNNSKIFNLNKFYYNEKVIDHYEKPRNVGSFDKKSKEVGTGLVGAPACGDVMKLQIKVNEDGIIENAVFKVNLLKFLLYYFPLLINLVFPILPSKIILISFFLDIKKKF